MLGGHYEWVFAKNLRAGDTLTRSLPEWIVDNSYEAGYLAAAIDGEGYISKQHGLRIGFAQSENEMYEYAKTLFYGWTSHRKG